MSECDLARCQQDRKIIRREFNKWTKNILLQIGLETISKNHLEFDINSFNDTNDEQIPVDFNPNQTCLFCLNRQEYFSIKKIHHNKTNICVNEDTEPIINDEENSPLDLSLKSTSNLNSRSFDMQSDILPIYNPEEFLLSSHMNLDYLSQSFPNMNLFSSLPINQQYQFNSSSFLKNDYVTQLAKQMAYLRMIQEIENQRNNKKSKVLTNGSAQSSSSSILTESMHVNQIINDIMIRTLNEIFEEQTKQQTRVSKQGELLFVKKQNQNNDDITILNTKKHQHNNQLNPSSSNSSSTSSVSSRCSPSVFTKTKSQSKQSSSHTPRRRPREIIPNSKIIVAMDGKQIRPKRGQYRRYESEQLAKAVAAVLSNEMSVHKAGSYFGVPHSTLEYKVKERNSKMPITTKNNNELSPSISSMPINDDNNNISRTKSMEYDDGDDNDQLLLGKNNSTNEDHHEMNDEEIQLYIPIELETN